MAKRTQKNPAPPEGPGIKRRLQFYPVQLIGIPLMMLIPILAMLGILGETDDKVAVSHSGLEMQVMFPSRIRYKMIDTVTVSLSNNSAQPLPIVEVRFDRDYVERFSAVAFMPSIKHITDTAYVVELNDLQPGETRIISVSIQADKYGRHRGMITATPVDGEPLQTSIETFTFP